MNPYLNIINNSPDQATSMALQAGADPIDLIKAKSQLGKQDYIGYCESFVEQTSNSGWKGMSASDAWQNQQDEAVQGLGGIQPGDKVYFSDPNNADGHVGIMDKDNNFISATDNGIEENNINEWMRLTGQNPLGYIPIKQNPYLKMVKGGNNELN